MRYNPEWMMECVEFRLKSQKAYKHLRDQNILPLPCMSTMQKLLASLAAKYGICQFAMDTLEEFVKGKPFNDRLIVIGHDEMTVAADVKFNKTTKQFDGLLNEDYLEGTNSSLNIT